MHRIQSNPQASAATPAHRGRPEKQFKIGDRLSMRDLSLVTKDLKDENSKWIQFAIQLDVAYPTCTEIERSARSGSSLADKFQQGLTKWLETDADPTWAMVADALKCRSNNRLSKTILEKYRHTQTNILTMNDLSTLQTELREMQPSWYNFCVSLGVSTDDLSIINDKKGTAEFMNEVLAHCIEREAGLTYKEIFDALEAVGNRRLKAQLESKRITH